MLADRCCNRPPRGSVGVDVAADLAGDVGFARKRQQKRDEPARAPSANTAVNVSSRPWSLQRAAPSVRSAATLSTSRRVASVCSACQR
jgi:hypothetical protein